VRDADHQLPRGGDPRNPPDQEAPGGDRRRRDRRARDNERLAVVRSPGHRRAGGRGGGRSAGAAARAPRVAPARDGVNPRELLQSAQAAEREGDLARAGALLEQAAQVYESTGHPARAAQMRRHVERLGPAAHGGARGVEEPPGGRSVHGSAPEPESLPGLDRALVERTPTLAVPGLEAWCSFCCRPSREVGALVAGPAHAYVCRGCVELAASLLDRAPQARSEGEPTPRAPDIALRVAPGPMASDSVRGTAFEIRNRPEPLPTQAEAVRRIQAALGAGHARVLLVGAAGSGKTTWLQTWASRGLGTAWDGSEPLPEHGPLLVDDVDQLEAAARRQLARVLGTRTVVLALDATL